MRFIRLSVIASVKNTIFSAISVYAIVASWRIDGRVYALSFLLAAEGSNFRMRSLHIANVSMWSAGKGRFLPAVGVLGAVMPG